MADDTGFTETGLDSIMVIDLRTRLADALGTDLPATVALDHPTVSRLAAYVTGLLFPAEAARRRTRPATAPPPSGPRPRDAPGPRARRAGHRTRAGPVGPGGTVVRRTRPSRTGRCGDRDMSARSMEPAQIRQLMEEQLKHSRRLQARVQELEGRRHAPSPWSA
ncbi:phosphopantetheine-binding protein [Streptomyces zhihengii]